MQRLVLTELLDQDHREEVRPGPVARDDVERGGSLADALAAAIGEPFAHLLDDLQRARHHLKGLGGVLSKFGLYPSAEGRLGL